MSRNDPRDEIVDHLPALRAFASSLTRDASSADDLVQDTIVKAWSNIERFDGRANMRGWLFTILRNTFYSHYRKRRREVEDIDGAAAARLAEKPAHDGRLQLNEFRQAFARLPDEQREALILVGAGGFSYEEAAQMTGTALGTVKSRVNRARARLAEILELEDGGELLMTDTGTVAVLAQHGTASV